MPEGTFWEKASFFILAVGTLIAIGRTARWAWPYLKRHGQFKLEVGTELCSSNRDARLSGNEVYKPSQILSVTNSGTITFLLRLKSKQKHVFFKIRYLGADGKDFSNSVITLEKAEGFHGYPQYWNAQGQSDYQGGLQGQIAYPDGRRDAEKDCHMKITAKVMQSCCGILKFEGRYSTNDGRGMIATSKARLNIRFMPSTLDKGDSQTE